MGPVGLWLFLAGPPVSETVVPFRTEVAPRVDAVFGDAAAYRNAVDRFLTLQGEMDKVREEFAHAVHATLGALAGAADKVRKCPETARAPYQKALVAGARFLTLGRELEARFREVRRHDDLGDTVALTPDYRFKVKRARELYLQLLRDFREMRIAFHEQLAAELAHARCRLEVEVRTPDAGPAASDPLDLAAWTLEDPAAPAKETALEPAARPPPEIAAPGASLPPTPAQRVPAVVKARASPASPAAAPAIWIEIDNSRCAEPSRLSIDGAAVGEIPGRKKLPVRARSGPHDLCVLPASDTRACGDPGTVRRAYLHEGWSLSVRCEK